MKITVQSPIQETPRVQQVRGMFDLPASKTSLVEWDARLPLGERLWNVGLVVGPSGCGKSTIARHLWPDAIVGEQAWPRDAAIVDGFPDAIATRDVVELLSSVGFASPPAWLRPYHVLSTGQQFRVSLARAIAEAGNPSLALQAGGDPSLALQPGGDPSLALQAGGDPSLALQPGGDPSLALQAGGDPSLALQPGGNPSLALQPGGNPSLALQAGGNPSLAFRANDPLLALQAQDPSLALRAHWRRAQETPHLVFDEYTSVVDRTVAEVASHALQKTIRQRKLRFVAVTCHEDVEAWLNPDWVYRPAEGRFAWRLLRRRPAIDLAIVRCRASAWRLFAPHHYLSSALARSAVCFLASWHDRPVAFSAWLPFVGSGPSTRREHRTVTLPDFQGVGIGNAVSDTIASMWTALGYRAISTTTHPAMIRSRCRSPRWRMTRRPALATGREKKLTGLRHATTRLTAGFAYIGPAMPRLLASALLGN